MLITYCAQVLDINGSEEISMKLKSLLFEISSWVL